MKIASNAAAGTTSTANDVYWNADTPNNDQYAQVTTSVRDSTGNETDVICRCSTSAATMYLFAVFDNRTELYKVVSGAYTQLGSTVFATVTNATVCKLECIGTAIKTYLDASVQNSVTDSTIASGRIGFGSYYTTNRISSFAGGNTGGGGTAYTQSVAGAFPALSGTITRLTGKRVAGALPAPSGIAVKRTNKSVSGALPAPSGNIAKQIGKAISGVFASPSGVISKLIAKVVTGALPAPSGLASTGGSFSVTPSGAFPSPTGGISKGVGKQVAGNLPSGSGSVTKQTSKTVAGNLPAPAGAATEAISFHQAVSGIMGAIIGGISYVLNPVVSLTAGAAKIIGSAFRRIIGG